MGLKQQVLGGVKWNSVSVVVNTVVQLLRMVVLARILDVSDFGILAIAMAIVSFTEIFADLGFTVPIIHKQNITDVQYSSVYWVNIIVSVIIVCVLLVLAPFIASIYNEPRLKSIVMVLSSIVLINAMGKLFQTIKTKEMDFKFISIVSIVCALIGFVTTLVLALLDFNVWSLVIGTMVQTLIRQMIYCINGLKCIKISFQIKFGEIKDFLSIGGYHIGAQIMDFVANKIDVFILGRILGMEALGIYNLAKEFIIKIYATFVSLSRSVMTSAFAKIQESANQLKQLMIKYCQLYSYIVVPIFCVLIIFPFEMCSIMYGGEKAELMTVPVRVLAFYGIFTSLCAPVVSLILALGKTNYSLKWTIVCAIANIGFVSIAGFWGINAVLVSQVILSVLLYVLNWKLLVSKMVDISLRQYINMSSKAIGIACVVSLVFLIASKVLGGGFVIFFLMTILFLIVYTFVSMRINKIRVSDVIVFVKGK